jgi:hypothetical protein
VDTCSSLAAPCHTDRVFFGQACFWCHPWVGLAHDTVQPAHGTSGL